MVGLVSALGRDSKDMHRYWHIGRWEVGFKEACKNLGSF